MGTENTYKKFTEKTFRKAAKYNMIVNSTISLTLYEADDDNRHLRF